MTIDLIVIGFIGFFTELLSVYINGIIIPWTTPVFVVSIVIITLAVSRWKAMGLLIIPSQALATFLAGKFLLNNVISNGEVIFARTDMYTFETYIALVFSYCGCAISFMLIKFLKNKMGDNHKILYRQLFFMFNCSCVIIVQLIIYNVFSILLESDISSRMAINIMSNSIFGIVITFILGNILFHQNIYIKQKDLLTQRKKEIIYEENYYDKYNYTSKNVKESKNEEINNRKVSDSDGA